MIDLPPRLLRILHGIANGETNEEIGAVLHLSAATVKDERMNLMRRLGAHTSAGAVAVGFRTGLLDAAGDVFEAVCPTCGRAA